MAQYRSAVQAYVQWHRTWLRTHDPNHYRVTLICFAIARERHTTAKAAFAGETLNRAFRKQARRGGRTLELDVGREWRELRRAERAVPRDAVRRQRALRREGGQVERREHWCADA